MKRFLLALTVLLFPTGASAQVDLCEGLPTHKNDLPRTEMAKPAFNQWFYDPDIISTARIKRITDVENSSPPNMNLAVIKPVYSPIPAWNADESYLLLWENGRGYRLHNGTTYEFIKYLTNYVTPADLEQIYWDPVDPTLLYFPVAGPPQVVKYRVTDDQRTVLRDFTSICGGDYMFGESHVKMNANRQIGLSCGTDRFIYNITGDTVTGPFTQTTWSKPIPSPSGNFIFLGELPNLIQVYDSSFNYLYNLDVYDFSHSDTSILSDGREIWHHVAYDQAPGGCPVGHLTNIVVDVDVGDRDCWATIGGTHADEPSTGFPYPWSGIHVSATAFNNPNWIWSSVIGGCTFGEAACLYGWDNAYQGLTPPILPKGQDYLDNEIVISNVVTGVTCRVTHNRSSGKLNTYLMFPYFAEPHVTASPSGTRAVFASDWGPNGNTNGQFVDTYVIELPAYQETGALAITTSSPLPTGLQNSAYSQQITAAGGTAPYTYAKTAGTLPTGVTVSSSGVVGGTPTNAGTFNFTVTVTDSEIPTPNTDDQVFDLTISDLDISTTSPMDSGSVGAAYSDTVVATGGTSPYTFSKVSGTLPTGLVLTGSTGVIAGTPEAAGVFDFVIRVTDSAIPTPITRDKSLQITITSGTLAWASVPQIEVTSTSAVIRFSVPGLDQAADCIIHLLNSGGTEIDSETSTSGFATRSVSFPGLAPADPLIPDTHYKVTRECVGAENDVVQHSFRTLPSAQGGARTVLMDIGAPSVLSGASRCTVEYDDNEALSSSLTETDTTCDTGGSVQLTLLPGLYYWRLIWKTAADAILATGSVQPLVVQ